MALCHEYILDTNSNGIEGGMGTSFKKVSMTAVDIIIS